MPGHALHAKRQHHRQNRRQALGHCGHGQGHTEQQDLNHITGVANIRRQKNGSNHHQRDDDHSNAEHAADAGDLFLQRRRVLFGGFQHVRDRTHLGCHARSGYDSTATALGNCRALEHHVQPVAQRCGSRERGGILEHAFAFAGQRRLLHAQRGRFDQTRIGAYRIAFVQHQQITAHQLGAGYTLLATITHNRSGHRRHVGQRGNGLLGLAFLHKTEHRIEQHNRCNDHRVDWPALAPFQHPGEQRNANGDQQQVDQRILKVLQNPPPGRVLWRGAQFVCAVCTQTARRLRLAQTPVGVGIDRSCDRCAVYQ